MASNYYEKSLLDLYARIVGLVLRRHDYLSMPPLKQGRVRHRCKSTAASQTEGSLGRYRAANDRSTPESQFSLAVRSWNPIPVFFTLTMFLAVGTLSLTDGLALTMATEHGGIYEVLEAISRGSGPQNYLVALGYAGWEQRPAGGRVGTTGVDNRTRRAPHSV